MKLTRALPLILLLTSFVFCQTPAAPQASSQPPNPLAPGQKLIDQGTFDDAIAFYDKAIAANANDWAAYLGKGAALDLQGKYDAARQQFTKAAEVAPLERKSQALRSMAVSYAFQKNANEAARYEQQAFDWQMSKQQYAAAAGVADELARIYLESGDYKNAYKWYETGHETALKDPKLNDAARNLWAFRWESAQARIAARRGDDPQAQEHAAAAKAIIEKGGNPEQAQFVPYIQGYVDFYAGNYAKAIDQLQKANQDDPFILVLLAQAYDKAGQQQKAMEYYRKVLQINSHNPANAFARPLAEEKVRSAS